MVRINFLILVSNKMYFLSNFATFPGALFYIYVVYNAVNLDDYMDETNRNSKFMIILGIFEISLAIFGAAVIIILTMIFIKISRNKFNKLMTSEMEFSTGRLDDNNSKNIK